MADLRRPSQTLAPANSRLQESCFRPASAGFGIVRSCARLWKASIPLDTERISSNTKELHKVCHPDEGAVCPPKDPGELRESVAVLATQINRAFSSLPYWLAATEYYSSAHRTELIRYSSFCNPIATSPQYRKVIKLPF